MMLNDTGQEKVTTLSVYERYAIQIFSRKKDI